MTAAWNVNNLYAQACRVFVFGFKFATKPARRHFNSSNARTHTRPFNFSFDQPGFFSTSFGLKCNSHTKSHRMLVVFVRALVRLWCWRDGLYFPFQYETISLFCICLTVRSAHKSIYGILYAHTRKKRHCQTHMHAVHIAHTRTTEVHTFIYEENAVRKKTPKQKQ